MEEKIIKPKINQTLLKGVLFLSLITLIIIGYSIRVEYLEYLEIGEKYLDVFWSNLKSEYLTRVINFLVIFISVYITNKLIHRGLKKFFILEGKKFVKLPNKTLAYIIAIIISVITSSFICDKIMLCFNSAWFGISDPIFNLDVGYYMFQKPLITLGIYYIGILAASLIVYTTIYYIVTINTYLDGIDMQMLKSSGLLKQILAGIIILSFVIGIWYYFNIQDMVFGRFLNTKSEFGTWLVGAGFSDVYIKIWSYRIMPIIIVGCVMTAIMFFKREKYRKSGIAISIIPGYLLFVLIVYGVTQFILVAPNEYDKEKWYIENNMKYTRNAYNLNIEEKEITYGGAITEEMIERNRDIINNVTLIDSDTTLIALNENQTSKGYYQFKDTDMALYNINNEEKAVYISPREINVDRNRTYSNKRYEYTHGYAVIVTMANETDETGNVQYGLKTFDKLNVGDQVTILEPRIYFGELTNEHIVTKNKNAQEFDYPVGIGIEQYSYTGKAGLNVNYLDRVLLAIENGDPKLIFDTGFTDASKILINRNIIKRAQKIAPFLIYDSDPYLVVDSNGRLIWVIDGYTTSNQYPYSQTYTLGKQKINYIRNSVKILVDAYDGTTTFYITDRSDPIIMSYWKMYPNLFADLDKEPIPEDILKNTRYPKAMYNIQSKMLERYHEMQPEVFYRNDDVWATISSDSTVKMTNPSYSLIKTEDGKNKLSLMIPYTPANRKNIIGYLVSNNNKTTVYKYAKDTNVLGPTQLNAQINQDETINSEISILNKGGLKINKNMTIIPIENTLLYVEPIYQVAVNETQVPVLKKIIVSSGNKLAIGNTYEEAIKNLLSQSALNIEIEETDNVNDLLNAIIKANENLKKSTTKGDWELFGKDLQKLQELLNKLEILVDEQNKNKTENKNEINNNIVNTEM